MDARVQASFLKALERLDAEIGDALEPRLRDMIRLRVSHLNGCHGSIRMHSEALAQQGARHDLISALARPARQMREGLVADGDAAALRFAEVLTDAPRGLEAEAREHVGAWFNASQIGAIVEVVAITNAWNRVLRGMD
ncbi:carboxymuconolactone decarboxylase family protein [Demequina mangrovi]|uniref:Alkylhydroperoxidase AhpD family core domain-containing protein n=1 Tax=Demequina mangrovi TaxID=1043493 RepID=A0A1H6ZV66_9MICO|nr:carboxymuconolactone decarboxylase family protein [Demequina mangrovi]SEJ52695.1 alkylhydroperoxidase AhpD family core domain-containing protein [Demequina mangrovi]